MGARLMVAFLAAVLAAAAETLSVEQLVTFLRSAARQNSDKETAAYLGRVKLSERLDARTIEVLQGAGVGPKTLQALQKLRAASAGLPPAAPVSAPAPPKPIPPPSSEVQAEIVAGMREYALNYSRNLPDFICAQVTRRRVAPTAGGKYARYARGAEPNWQTIDTLTIRLSYFEQKEDYKLILRNNTPVTQDYGKVGGPKAFGSFGSLLRQVFEPATQARFEWERWGRLNGRVLAVFNYRVRRENSQYRLVAEDLNLSVVTAYHGLVMVDPETHAVMRITVVADGLPSDFPIRGAETVLDYDYQDLSGRRFLLPLRSRILMTGTDTLNRIDEEFRLYRKYSAESQLKFDTEPLPPLPEIQSGDNVARPPEARKKE